MTKRLTGISPRTQTQARTLRRKTGLVVVKPIACGRLRYLTAMDCYVSAASYMFWQPY